MERRGEERRREERDKKERETRVKERGADRQTDRQAARQGGREAGRQGRERSRDAERERIMSPAQSEHFARLAHVDAVIHCTLFVSDARVATACVWILWLF